MILSPQQQCVVDQLLPVARIATTGIRAGLPILARTHSLIIGPSGSGKSFVARQLGEMLGIPTLVVNVATWVIIASRSEPWTFSIIADWLDRLPGGGVLVLDECDKMNGDSEYTKYVRLEIHDLLDGIIPAAAKLPIDPPEDADISVPGENGQAQSLRDILSRKLKEQIMVVGCGAWQAAWRKNTRTLGFTSEKEALLPEPPTRDQILQCIDAELRQRFRDEIAVLPPMMSKDYALVARQLAKFIPEEARSEWNKALGATLRQAADGSLGMRAFEELLLKALVLSGHGKEPQIQPEKQNLAPPRTTASASLW